MGNIATVVPISEDAKKECHICLDTTDYKLAKCTGCKKWYCTDHASKANLLYCEHCVMDIAVVEEEFQRIEEDYDEETDEVKVTKSPTVKKITYEGADWTFQTTVIRNLSDEELRIQCQVMRGAVSLMEHELTQRKIRKTIVVRDQQGNVLTKRVTETKTKTTTKSKKPIDLAALAEKLMALKLTPDQMQAILKTL